MTGKNKTTPYKRLKNHGLCEYEGKLEPSSLNSSTKKWKCKNKLQILKHIDIKLKK